MPSDPVALKAWVASLSRDELMTLAQQLTSGALSSGLGSLPDLSSRNREIDLPKPPEEPSLLTLTIELRGSKPRIWRRLRLPGDLTLEVVHTLFQAAMGWSDSHLHRFQPGIGKSYNEPYFITEFDEDEGEEGTREDGVRLDQVLRAPGDRLTYLYDFGDGWEHRVTLESLSPLTSSIREPACLGGAKACPPEDVGGISGHHQLAEWLRVGAPNGEVPEPFQDAADAYDWLPVGYDPDVFDAAEATAAMRAWASGTHLPWHGLPDPLVDLVQGLRGEGWSQVITWLTALSERAPIVLDAEDVRRAARPWSAVLEAVGAGTQLTASGYLPPDVVEQIARSAGITQWWIGKANREDLTPPVATLRHGAEQVGLLRKTKGALIPTPRARAVADQPRELVGTVLQRLPLGKGFEAEAGWLCVLGLAGGKLGAELGAGVALMLSGRGWGARGNAGVTAADAQQGAKRTLDALEAMAGGRRTVDATLVVRLARATLFGVAAPE